MSNGKRIGVEASLQRAIADACLEARAGEAIASDLRGWLEEHGVAEEDIAAILAAPARLGIYRSLVRNGLASVVVRVLARTRALMNAAAALGRFDADLATFVEEAAPRTHYLRDVPAEFFAWVEPRWRASAEIPPYLPDLASFELAHFAVAASASARVESQVVELAIDLPLAFHASTRLLRHAWAVHQLLGEDAASPPPEERDVRLLAYRDAEHTVRWLELTPLAAAIVERLLAGDPLGDAVTQACATRGTATAVVLPDIARLLADLAARGVILGGSPDL